MCNANNSEILNSLVGIKNVPIFGMLVVKCGPSCKTFLNTKHLMDAQQELDEARGVVA